MPNYNLPVSNGSTTKQEHDDEVNRVVGDAEARAKERANHTGTQPISTVAGLNDALNQIDQSAKERANHTGTQPISTVAGLNDALNQIDQATQEALAEARGLGQSRPGRGMASWVTQTAGAPSGLPSLADDPAITSGTVNGLGECAIVANAQKRVAPREAYAVHSGRVYLAYFVARRTSDTADISGAGVRFALDGLGSNYASLGITALDDRTIWVGSGIQRAAFTFAVGSPPLGDVDVELAGATVQVRPYVESYGLDKTDAIAQIQILDVTEAVTVDGALDAVAVAHAAMAAQGAIQSASDATAAAGSARFDADRAEAALDGVALVAGSTGYQPDVATAEGALTDGDIFWTVVGAEIVQYQIISGSAVEIEGARLPSAALVRQNQAGLSISLTANRLTHAVTINTDGRRVDNDSASVISNVYAGLKARVDTTGKLQAPREQTQKVSLGSNYRDIHSETLFVPDRTLDIILSIGQSYNLGQRPDDPVFDDTPLFPGRALMPENGTWPGTRPVGSLVDLIGGVSLANVKDPPVVTAVNHIVGSLIARFGDCQPIVGVIGAQGGQPYLALKKGTSRFSDARRALREIARESRKMGLRPVLRCLLMCHGEADAALSRPARAVEHMLEWRQDYEDAARALFGQTETVRVVTYATNRAPFSGAIRESAWPAAARILSETHPHLFCHAGAVYAVEIDETDHPDQTGYRRLGFLLGKAALSHCYGTGFIPTRPERVYWTSPNSARIECFVPYGGDLVRDESGDIVGYTSDTSAPEYIGPTPDSGPDTARDAGFYVRDKDGSFGVTSAVVDGSNIDLIFSRAGHVGSTRIGYAVRGQSETFSGTSENTARGIIRGSVGFPLAGSAIETHDWLIPFVIQI